MRPFAYARPTTRDEALDLLARERSTVLAGGTILLLTRLTLDVMTTIDHFFLSLLFSFVFVLQLFLHKIFLRIIWANGK